jgi:hypothetical protein
LWADDGASGSNPHERETRIADIWAEGKGKALPDGSLFTQPPG